MERRALLVGIDHYKHISYLNGCVADATAIQELLEAHEDGSPNYHCRLLVSSQGPVTRAVLRSAWNELFDNFEGDAVFHFSGHGSLTNVGGFLATYEWEKDDPGLPMDELLALANKSQARSVLLILDCCHSGYLGNAAVLQAGGSLQDQAHLREGVTILAASRPHESSFESDGHGVFANLILGALSGGAADVRGLVSAASVYAYAEQALGPWEQRPIYKSHAARLSPIRRCEPAVPDSVLRELPKLFSFAKEPFHIAPSYEKTDPLANPEHVTIFDKLKVLRNARLLVTQDNEDLYFVALGSGWVKLSPLGQFYWKLAKSKRV